MTRATITTKLDTDNPWPGLESYCEDAQGFFYGRGHECEKLLKKVLDAPVTVLFGRSGLGKTSLLHAGLFPLLRNENFLPIYVRFDLKPGAASLSSQLHDAVRNAIGAEAPDALLPRDDESLWEYLHRADLELWSARNYLLTPVIVLDQFEELFTLGVGVPDQVEAFKYDLADLAENRIPAELAVRIKNDPAEARRFNLRAHNCKLLISLREDFLAHLEDWCRFIPALGRARMRLLPLATDEAFDAVYKPAEHLMTPELAHQVVGIIAGAGLHTGADSLPRDGEVPASRRSAGEVEPTLLSLVCRELNEERKRLGKATFDEQLVDEHGRSTIPNYYISCVSGMRAGVAEFIENQLITKTGFRDFEAVEDAVPSRLTPEELDQLISSRLVRLAEYHGTQRIELVHDVLTGTVREHRDRREAEEDRRRAEQQKENEKAAIAAAAEQERQALAQAAKLREAELDRERLAERDRRLESEKAAARRLKWALVALAIACTTALVLAGVAFWQRGVAQTRSREARIDQLYVNSQLMLGGLSPLGSHDVKLLQMLLAAQAIPSTLPSRSYELLTTLNKERDLLKIIDLPVPTKALSLSRDGSRIVSGGEDDVVRLWSSDGRPVGGPMRHEDKVTSVAFSPDGSRIASASQDGTVQLWDTRTGRQVGSPMIHPGSVNSVAFSADGTRIATGGSDRIIRLFSVAKDQSRVIGYLLGHESAVNAVAFDADQPYLATASSDGTVRLWDLRWQRMVGHDGEPWAGYFDDGRRIGSGSSDKTVRWWDPTTGQPIGEPLRVDDPDAKYLFPADEHRLVSFGSNDDARLWDARTGTPIGEPLRVPGEPYLSTDYRVTRIAAQLEPRVVQVYRTDSMQPVGRPVVPAEDIWRMSFSHDGRTLATAGDDGTIELWNADTGDRLGPPMNDGGGPAWSIEFSPDGHLLAAGNEDYNLRLWRTDSFTRVGEPLALEDALATATAFSSDGRMVAAGGDDGTIRLWNVADQTPLGAPISVHNGSVMSMQFSSDGTRLLSASDDNTLRIWPVLPADPNLLCAKLTHVMTRDQWKAMVPGIEYQKVCQLPESEYAG